MHSNTEVMFLGCGHSESIVNYNNNAAVISAKGNMLIDCGHTIKHALDSVGMNIGNIDSIYISHVHGDHVFGLERFAYETKFKYDKKVKLIFHESLYTELWDQTLKGSLGRNGDGEASLEDYFDVEVLKDEIFYCHGSRYELVPVQHTPGKPTFGLLINNKFFHSADTTAIPDTINSLDFEVGCHDVTLSEYNPVHATLNSLMESYPEKVRKKLYLMSYEDTWRDYEDVVEKEFKGFAKQGMRISL